MPERQDLYVFAGAISQVHNAQVRLRFCALLRLMSVVLLKRQILWRQSAGVIILPYGAIYDSQEPQPGIGNRVQAAV